MSSPRSTDRFHGRMRGSVQPCASPECAAPGEFRAPDPTGRNSGPNGPGDYQYLCLDHVREFNSAYDWFDGMDAEAIAAAQSPLNVWPTETRAFRSTAGVDNPPKWADFHDPLDAISARFRAGVEARMPKKSANGTLLSQADKHALGKLSLTASASRRDIRRAYSEKLRRFHPDKNGGDRTHEKALQDVIAAYTHLKQHAAFA